MPSEAVQSTRDAAQPATEERSVLDRIAEDGRIGQSPEERSNGKLWLKDLIQEVMTGQMTVSNDTEVMLNSRIADLDALISQQLNEVMHAAEFQKLEGSWRGLNYLVQQTETSSSLKIKLMNVSKADLLKDFKNATEFDQSAIFKKIYEEEYGTLGGNPFGVLVGDYEFGRHPQGWRRHLTLRLSLPPHMHYSTLKKTSQSLPARATLKRFSITRRISSGTCFARATIPAMWGCACHTCSCACRMARKPFPSKSSISRRTWTGKIIPNICGATRRTLSQPV
jgi:hypothetical protein